MHWFKKKQSIKVQVVPREGGEGMTGAWGSGPAWEARKPRSPPQSQSQTPSPHKKESKFSFFENKMFQLFVTTFKKSLLAIQKYFYISWASSSLSQTVPNPARLLQTHLVNPLTTYFYTTPPPWGRRPGPGMGCPTASTLLCPHPLPPVGRGDSFQTSYAGPLPSHWESTPAKTVAHSLLSL